MQSNHVDTVLGLPPKQTSALGLLRGWDGWDGLGVCFGLWVIGLRII